MKKFIPGLMIGNAFEHYDFILFGFLSHVIGPKFFPTTDPFYSFLLSLTVFSVGHIFRPLGSLIFGYIGDKYGRKIALSYAILFTAFPSGIISLLPTFEVVGYIAPLMLVVLRTLQGIGQGGEFPGVVVFSIEIAEKNKGTIGATVASSGIFGFVIGSLVCSFFSLESMPDWAWRVPFAIGFFLCFVGFFIRRKLLESREFIQKKSKDNPFICIIQRETMRGLVTMFMAALSNVSFYLMFFYVNTILSKIWSPTKAYIFNSTVLIFYIFCMIGAGWLADKFSPPRVLRIFSILLFFCLIPIFYLVGTKNREAVICAQILGAMLTAGIMGPQHVYFSKIWDSTCRYSGVSVYFSLAVALFGSTAPVVTLYIENKFHTNIYMSFYVQLLAILAFWGIHHAIKKKWINN